MREEAPRADFWGVLEEATETVEQRPSWQQRYEADIYTDEWSAAVPAAGAAASRAAVHGAGAGHLHASRRGRRRSD